MENWNFEEIYESAAGLLGEINRCQRSLQEDVCGREHVYENASYLLNTLEKNILFVRTICRNIEPAYKTAMGRYSDRYGIMRARSARLMVEEVQTCVNALILMANELFEAYKTEVNSAGELYPLHVAIPDLDFDKATGFPPILKAGDYNAKIKRMHWLIDNYHTDANVRRYLKMREAAIGNKG